MNEQPLLPTSKQYVKPQTDGDLTFIVVDQGAVITGCNTSITGTLPIKTSLGGCPVTSIAQNAFQYCNGLDTVYIPNTITHIDYTAFLDCKSLSDFIELGVGGLYCSVKGALFYSNPITGVLNLVRYPPKKEGRYSVPPTVTAINSGAFFDCRKLLEITIPPSVKTIGPKTFSNCYGLKDVPGLSNVTNIEHETFSGCNGMTKITIPPGVTSIGNKAFARCLNLSSVNIPASVTSIACDAFADCTRLASIAVDSGNANFTSDNRVLFDKKQTAVILACPVWLSNYTVPSTVRMIGDSAFAGCVALNTITIPSSVTSIGKNTFSGCSQLSTITLPSGITSIGDGAFSGCNQLRSITIPASVTSIGSNVFDNCPNLAVISVAANNAFFSSDHGVLLDKAQTTIVRCPANKAGDYAIPNKVSKIAEYAFSGCKVLTSVTIPESVTGIGANAFSDCAALTNINITARVTSIETGTFSGCTGLTSFAISAGVTAIGKRAFFNCSSLTAITLPTTLKRIDEYAFTGCSALTSVHIPASVKELIFNAFSACSGLMELTVEANNPAYMSDDGVVFDKTHRLLITYPAGRPGDYIVPPSVIEIAPEAFYQCNGLTQVTIPSTDIFIHHDAFSKCANLMEVAFLGNVPSVAQPIFDFTTNTRVSFSANTRGWSLSVSSYKNKPS